MVGIGIIGLALSDPHFCILSGDCFNLSREYFSLWAIKKKSLDRNASALLDPEVIFSRVARHLAWLNFRTPGHNYVTLMFCSRSPAVNKYLHMETKEKHMNIPRSIIHVSRKQATAVVRECGSTSCIPM